MNVYGWVFKLHVHSIGQLTMPDVCLQWYQQGMSAKYMFAMVPTKDYSIQNSAFGLSQKL